MNSRQKGARGERELRDELRAAGFVNARRGQQFAGTAFGGSPDVICPELPSVHWEVKRVQAGNPYRWMAQAVRDAGDKMPVVAHRRNDQEWLAVVRLDDLIKLLIAANRSIKI